ncbi:MAG: hypothetical protein ACYDC7_11885 [Acidithiobacillus ferrivorans]
MSDRSGILKGAYPPRAIRRHHRHRLWCNRRFHWNRDLSGDQRTRAQAIDTSTPCSCWMCGNPRKYFGEKTMQERKKDQEKEDGMK